jgi:hypothetical protein
VGGGGGGGWGEYKKVSAKRESKAKLPKQKIPAHAV